MAQLPLISPQYHHDYTILPIAQDKKIILLLNKCNFTGLSLSVEQKIKFKKKLQVCSPKTYTKHITTFIQHMAELKNQFRAFIKMRLIDDQKNENG